MTKPGSDRLHKKQLTDLPQVFFALLLLLLEFGLEFVMELLV